MSQTLSQRLRQTRRVLQRRRWLALLVGGGLATALLLLLLAGVNRWRPMQEENAFLFLLTVLAGFVIYAGWSSYRVWRWPPPLPELAARVEEKHPEWMDALICAAEQEQKPQSKLRPLERALVARMEEKTATIDFEAALLPVRWKNLPLLAALTILLVLTALLLSSSFVQKGGYFLADLARGEGTGLRIDPGNGEAPVRTDVRVAANVLRWENEPEIEYIDETGRHRFPMHLGRDDHSFTFYDIGQDVRYRILTPSLRSAWYQVSPYTPPSIDRARIRITPPGYTGLPEEEFDQLRGVTAIEGSRIEWALVSPTAVSAALRVGDRDLPMEAAPKTALVSGEDAPAPGDGAFALSLQLRESFTGRFVIEDEAGRSARTPEFPVTAKPDLPPTIEVTQPGRDTQADPAAEVALTALAADDFGLTEITLHVSLSGQRQPPVGFFANAGGAGDETARVPERTVRTAIDLSSIEAEEGDVAVYFLTATDNREPEAQQTRSEVYFIEVREEITPEEMEGEPMELEQIDLQALIVELKRLIRLSWQAVATSDERVEREIAAGLEEVRLETARVQQEIIDQIGAEAAEPVVVLMNRSMSRMEAAGQLVDQRLVDDSIPHQEMALADLVLIQTELMKNQTTSDEPSEGSGEGSPQQEEMEQDDYLEEMQRLMAEVQKLSDDQAAQNSAMRRMAQRGLSPEQQAEFRRRQEEMKQRTEEVDQELSRLPGTESARRDLAAAASSMDGASEGVEANRAEAAAQDGDRARSSLLSALENLEDAMGEATGHQIAQLARQAQELAQQQGQAAGGSRGLAESDSPSAEAAAALREQQQAMRENLERLLSSMDDTANQLREKNPEAATAVAEAGQEVRDQNLAGEMGRAGNALLYRRFERAAEIQEAATQNLGQLAESLNESAGMMPSMSRQQLQQLLSQVQQSQQEVMGMTGQSQDEIGERLERIAERLGQRLSRAGQALRDTSLQEVSGQLGSVAQGDQAPNIFRMDGMLRAAARSLEQQIFALEVERRARLQRQVSEPPERYRGLVEEYFKNLSETP